MIERPDMTSTREPIITLTTDFGLADGYVGAMKGVLLQHCSNARLVDVTHEIAAQDVPAAALVLTQVVPYFPAHTVHLVVVDPGVGSARRPLIILAGEMGLVGPDNGVLVPAAIACAKTADFSSYEIEVSRVTMDRVSSTFHGRDIFARAAALLASGVAVDKMAHLVDDIVRVVHPTATRSGSGLLGEILHIDHFGNALTNIREELLADVPGGDVCLRFESREDIAPIHGVRQSYVEVEAGTPLIVLGSSGYLEVSVSMGSAAQVFGIARGMPVRVTFG